MYFGFVVVERFADGPLKGEEVFGNYCFEEEVWFGMRLRRIEDFV